MTLFGNRIDLDAIQAAAKYMVVLEDKVRARDEKLAAAGASIERLEGQVRRLQRKVEERDNALRARSDDESHARIALQARIAQLEEQLAELKLDKRILERRLDEVTDELESERAERDEDCDDDGVRQRVLRTQALRARLAKTDMRPRARLETLKEAARAGVELSREQRAELRELRDRYG